MTETKKNISSNTPPEISKEQQRRYAKRILALSIIIMYSSIGMAVGVICGVVVTLIDGIYHDLPAKAGIAGFGIGTIGGMIHTRISHG